MLEKSCANCTNSLFNNGQLTCKLTNMSIEPDSYCEGYEIESELEKSSGVGNSDEKMHPKLIKPSDKFVNRQYISGGIITFIGFLGIAIGAWHIIGLGIFFLIIASIQSKMDIIKIHENHFEIKLASLASTKYIKFSDLRKVERVSEKKIFVHYKQATDLKKFRVPVPMFEPKELSDFLAFLDDKLASKKS
jgi:hypothetical protein